MEEKNLYRRRRTIWVWVGLGAGFVARIMDVAFWVTLEAGMFDAADALIYLEWSVAIFAIGALIYGSYCWAKYKGRHGAFALFGLLAPIGFIPLALMKDKYLVNDVRAKEGHDGQSTRNIG